jgi:hypothetical protein
MGKRNRKGKVMGRGGERKIKLADREEWGGGGGVQSVTLNWDHGRKGSRREQFTHFYSAAIIIVSYLCSIQYQIYVRVNL